MTVPSSLVVICPNWKCQQLDHIELTQPCRSYSPSRLLSASAEKTLRSLLDRMYIANIFRTEDIGRTDHHHLCPVTGDHNQNTTALDMVGVNIAVGNHLQREKRLP